MKFFSSIFLVISSSSFSLTSAFSVVGALLGVVDTFSSDNSNSLFSGNRARFASGRYRPQEAEKHNELFLLSKKSPLFFVSSGSSRSSSSSSSTSRSSNSSNRSNRSSTRWLQCTRSSSSSEPPPENDSSQEKNNNKHLMSNIRQKLLNISNIASMLCVIDCTVLPIVTVVLPLIGMGVSSPEQAKFLHELGHSVAIFFVLPVGGLAATMNYLSSKSTFFASIALLGLSLIYAANGHGGPILSLIPHDIAHALHCGTVLHRVTNIIGCACLLSSNYFAHRISCDHDHHGGGCNHEYDHSHDHS